MLLRREWTSIVIFIFFSFCFSYRALLIDPNFIAEDGEYYYPTALSKSFIEIITLVYHGNYQFLTNLGTYLATLVSYEYAPFVTTWIAFFAAIYVAWQIGKFCRIYEIGYIISLLSALIWAFFPPGLEVLYNLTNMQWVLGISTLIICLTPFPDRTWQRYLTFLWLFACGLTGVTSLLLAPFFALRAYTCRSKCYLIALGIFFLCFIIQAPIVFMADHHAYRIFPALPIHDYFLALYNQILIAPLFGVEMTKTLANYSVDHFGSTSIILIGLSLILVAIFAYALKRTKQYSVIFILGVTIFIVGYIQVFGAINRGIFDANIHYAYAFNGGRYFAICMMALILLLALISSHKINILSLIILALINISMSYYIVSLRNQFYSSAASWKQGIAECKEKNLHQECRLFIWPGWGVNINISK